MIETAPFYLERLKNLKVTQWCLPIQQWCQTKHLVSIFFIIHVPRNVLEIQTLRNV